MNRSPVEAAWHPRLGVADAFIDQNNALMPLKMWLTLVVLLRWQPDRHPGPGNPPFTKTADCVKVSSVELARWLVPTTFPSGKLLVGAAPSSVHVAPSKKYWLLTSPAFIWL